MKFEKLSQHPSDLPVMPGVIVTTLKMPRPASGSALICFSPMTSVMRAEVVSTWICAADTSIVCSTAPISSVTFNASTDSVVTRVSLRSAVLNPVSSIRTP